MKMTWFGVVALGAVAWMAWPDVLVTLLATAFAVATFCIGRWMVRREKALDAEIEAERGGDFADERMDSPSA